MFLCYLVCPYYSKGVLVARSLSLSMCVCLCVCVCVCALRRATSRCCCGASPPGLCDVIKTPSDNSCCQLKAGYAATDLPLHPPPTTTPHHHPADQRRPSLKLYSAVLFRRSPDAAFTVLECSCCITEVDAVVFSGVDWLLQ